VHKDLIKTYWEVMSDFTDEERSLYLRFVWGRSRLPTFSESKPVHKVTFKRTSSPDGTLPEGHTW
jgi:hypothetical protein